MGVAFFFSEIRLEISEEYFKAKHASVLCTRTLQTLHVIAFVFYLIPQRITAQQRRTGP